MKHREIYEQKIVKYINTPFIKVITGMRRSGKTYFMRKIQQILQTKFSVLKNQIAYIDKENTIDFDKIRDYQDLIEYIEAFFKNISGKKYLLIDEVQEIKDWEKAVRAYGSKEDFDVYITGSNASLLSGELATFLTGRFIEFPIAPLTFKEFLSFRSQQNTAPDVRQEFSLFMKYGGLPGLHATDFSQDSIKNYLDGVFYSIVFRDIASRYHIRNQKVLVDIFHYLSENIGNVFSTTKTVNILKNEKLSVSVPTLKEYLYYFEDAFLLNKVKRYDLKGKKILEFYEKYYLEDLGLRSFFVGFETRDTGRIIENIVFLELKARGYDIAIGKTQDMEIDFVATKNGKTTLIQICYDITNAQTKAREIKPLIKNQFVAEKLILTMSEFEGEMIEGIPHQFLIDWLLGK